MFTDEAGMSANEMTDDEFLTRMRRVAGGGKWRTPEEEGELEGALTTMSMGMAGAAMEAEIALGNYKRLLAIIDKGPAKVPCACCQPIPDCELCDGTGEVVP